MKLDQQVQQKILEALKGAYPQRVDSRGLNIDCTIDELSANLRYLEEFGLIDAKWAGNFAVANVRITARGMDFLGGGGLSAILDVVTVRLHEDTLKAILIERVSQNPTGSPQS
jgi:hypothetical protein